MQRKIQKKIKAYREKQGPKGFTLVELIVVLVILAILAALLIPALTGYIRKAEEQRVIVSGRQAFLAAQTLASAGYASTAWEEPTKEAVLALSEVNGQIVTMTFTNPGIVDATEANPFRYQEGNIIARFANGAWTIEDGTDSDGETGGDETSGGDETGDGANPDGSVTLKDSAGNTYTIYPSASWSDIQNNIVAGWNITPGCVLSDETGTYLCHSNSNGWIKDPNAASWNVKDLVDRKPDDFIKLDSDAKIWTSSDISGGPWTGEPQKGELAFFKNKYYVAPNSLGIWTFPPGGWILIEQP